MIEVEHLSKDYSGHPAVVDVTFRVDRGEIVGLLGPNGAGKTTIMRILACYLPASSGTARVAGFDVLRESNEVRRRIGYMPENNPLHKDLRVTEYLRFRGQLKGLSRAQLRERLEVVLHQCGLNEVRHRIIGHLSKGYQQRVGLADALIHEPELLILDEPTIGLDPNQIRSVRQLIRDLAAKHTVLISSHILPEVEMTCGRVVILHEGRILAADTTENLQRLVADSGQVYAEVRAPVAELNSLWAGLSEVRDFDLEKLEDGYVRCTLRAAPGVDVRTLVFEAIRDRGWMLRELTRSRHSLEDIFVRVTRPELTMEEPVPVAAGLEDEEDEF